MNQHPKRKDCIVCNKETSTWHLGMRLCLECEPDFRLYELLDKLGKKGFVNMLKSYDFANAKIENQ